MADYLIKKKTLDDIAGAIRYKTGGSAPIKPEDMPDEIRSITTSSGENVQGEQTVTPTKSTQTFPPTNSGYTAVRKVTVNPIPSSYIIPSGTYPTEITSNGTYTVTKYETVIVAVPTNIPSGYHDTSSVDAVESDVVEGKTFVKQDGTVAQGSIVTNDSYQTIGLTSAQDSFNFSGTYYRRGGRVYVTVYEGTGEGDITISNITS